MKKLLLLVCISLSICSLVACGSKNDSTTSLPDGSIVESTVTGKGEEQGDVLNQTTADVSMETLRNLPITPESDFDISPYEEDSVILGAYKGSDNAIAIPDTIGGKRVVSIMGYSYANDTKLVGIRLPDSVTKMDEMVFTNSESLKYVILGSGLKELPASTFLNCPKLENIKLNEGLNLIGEMCFSNCISLTSIYIPESVTEIGEGAFFAVGNNFTIEGKAGSYAETYANANNIPFKAVQ